MIWFASLNHFTLVFIYKLVFNISEQHLRASNYWQQICTGNPGEHFNEYWFDLNLQKFHWFVALFRFQLIFCEWMYLHSTDSKDSQHLILFDFFDTSEVLQIYSWVKSQLSCVTKIDTITAKHFFSQKLAREIYCAFGICFGFVFIPFQLVGRQRLCALCKLKSLLN